MMFDYNRMANGKYFFACCIMYFLICSPFYVLLDNIIIYVIVFSFLSFSSLNLVLRRKTYTIFIICIRLDGRLERKKSFKIHFALVRTYSDAWRISSTKLHSTKGRKKKTATTAIITIEKRNNKSPTARNRIDEKNVSENRPLKWFFFWNRTQCGRRMPNTEHSNTEFRTFPKCDVYWNERNVLRYLFGVVVAVIVLWTNN